MKIEILHRNFSHDYELQVSYDGSVYSAYYQKFGKP